MQVTKVVTAASHLEHKNWLVAQSNWQPQQSQSGSKDLECSQSTLGLPSMLGA